MAIYRQVHISFWEDTKITDDFTAEDKYFMLYLLTNTKTNLLGCYEISSKQISKDMGYSVDCVKNLIYRFEQIHKVICYDENNKELLVKNWYKYNWNSSFKLDKALYSQIEKVKTPRFKNYLIEIYNQRRNTVSIPYPYPMDTTVSVTVPVTDTVLNNINNINSNIEIEETNIEIVNVEEEKPKKKKSDVSSIKEQVEIFTTDDEFKMILNEFVNMREKIKKKLTDYAFSLILLKLKKMSDDLGIQKDIINQSILNSWQDIYPLKATYERVYSNSSWQNKKSSSLSIDERVERAKRTMEGLS